eukprot:Nitzschia sp. Nitz4//scaffold127_size64804//47057//49390//NITZ4_006185-RA/size64804-processed-gene-0.70-mRNA-1//1//CDS//3329534777//8182//frame0
MDLNDSTETTHDPGSQSESIAADSVKGSQQGSNTLSTTDQPAPTAPAVTRPKVAKPAKNKPISVKRKRKFKPVGSIGEIETVDGFKEAMRDLNTRVPWFQENPIKASLDVKDTQVPPDLDWDDGKAVHAAFPPWKLENGFLLGTRQIPRCFLLDASTVTQKLVVVNWWKNMTKAEQADVVSKENIHRFYRAPMRSNSPYKFWHDGPDTKGSRVHRGDTNGSPSSSDARGHPGRPRRVFGAPIILKAPDDEPTLGFRMAACCQDLAVRFNLTVDQLYCATIDPENSCSIENCPYPAFLQNRTFCCLHKQNWWPRTGLEHYRKRRGHLLLGPEYTVRPFQQDKQQIIKTKVQPTPCGCSDLTCEGIGWSADMARVPRGYDIPDILTPNAHRDKDRPLRLAPWHFSPEHRVQLSDGTWQLDLENKLTIESFPNPDYDPKAFLEEPEMIEYQKRKNPFLLPEWVFEMCSKEEGPFTLQEFHVHTLREQRDTLLQQLSQKSTEYEDLSREHSRTELKLEELRRVQHQQKQSSPQKKSLKRSASSLPEMSNQQPYRRRLHDETNRTPEDNRRRDMQASQEGRNSGDDSAEEDKEVPRQPVVPRPPRHPLHSPTANLRTHLHFQHPTPHGASHLVPPHLANQLAHHHHHNLPPHLVHQHRSIVPQQQEGGTSVLQSYRDHEGTVVHEAGHAMHYLQHAPATHIPPSTGGTTGHSHAHAQVAPGQLQPQQPKPQQPPQTPHQQIPPNATTYYPVMGENTPTGATRTPPANNTGDIRGRWGFGYHR